MTISSEIDRTHTPTPTHWIQIGFYATSIVFNLCLIAQLLTVGVAYLDLRCSMFLPALYITYRALYRPATIKTIKFKR